MRNRGRTEIVAIYSMLQTKRSNQDKNYVPSFSKLWAIKGIPFCFDRKQPNRISGGGS